MKKRRLLIIIVLMLVLVSVLSTLLVYRGKMINAAKREEKLRDCGEMCRQAEEALRIVAKEAKDWEIASHVYSHRGTAGAYEHSFKAYDEAISAGSHNIEQDLVLSSDGVLFVSHNLNASYMTGIDTLYSNMTAEEIDGLETLAGYKVLRLSEVFDKYGRDINYIIELKTFDDNAITAFENIVDEYGFKDVITVQCSNTDVLKKLEEKYSDMPKLFICKSQQSLYESLNMSYVDIVSVDIDRGLMTESNCREVHDHDKVFSAWTLTAESSIRSAIDMNVDTYFTNDTPLALSMERDYGVERRKQNSREDEQ